MIRTLLTFLYFPDQQTYVQATMSEAIINLSTKMSDSKNAFRQQEMPHSAAAIVSQHQPSENDRNNEGELPPVGYCELFRFATKFDYVLMVLGTICACAMGTAFPAFTILWGNMTDSFNDTTKIVGAARTVMFQFIGIGAGTLVAGWGMFTCWMITGQRQGITCRKQYLKSLLRQQIGWFDSVDQSELSSKFATDCFAFQGAIGEKVSTLIMAMAMFVAAFIISFIYGWLMTLVVLVSLPVIGFGAYAYAKATMINDTQHEKHYSEAGGIVEQALSSIKTIKQLNGENHEAQKYSSTIVGVRQNSLKLGLYMGLGLGLLQITQFLAYSLGFWYGSHCVEGSSVCPTRYNGGQVYTVGDTIIIFFSILLAGFNLAQVTPAIKKITEGRSAAARIYQIIDRTPLVASPTNPIRPQNFEGLFKFTGVSFAYPKDKSRKILSNLNLELDCRSSAFVGDSGCGKSTIFQLMMRFYDPDEGLVTLDGIDLKDLDLNWLRSQIGYVGQQPVLFATTLKENLLYGKEDATAEQIDLALRKAEARDFVSDLSEGLDTFVGAGGGQISGGQKQRIAIARALLRDPKILLLDEATSALDRRNEKLIQRTLNVISEEKVTVTIAHRIKTIMSCDKIYVMEKGSVKEFGRFEQLERYKDVERVEEEEDQEEKKDLREKQEKHEINKNGILDLSEMPNQATKEEQEKKEQEEQLDQKARKKKQEEEMVQNYESENSISTRLFSYCSERKCTFTIGVITAFTNGLIYPIFSIFLAKMINVLLGFSDNPSSARDDANLYSLMFLVLGIAFFFLQTISYTIFNSIGEEVTEKIRNETYIKILRMPVGWFDKSSNNSGALSSRLSSDTRTLNGIITTYISIVVQNLSTLASSIGIAFFYDWRITLVSLGLFPFLILSGIVEMEFTSGFSAKNDAIYKKSSNLITECTLNIRTVSSFGSQQIVQRQYDKYLEEPLKMGVKKGNVSGLVYGISQFILYLVFALIFYLGAIFIRDYDLSISDVFVAIYAIMFGGLTIGNTFHFMPDVASAKVAAVNIFNTLDADDEDQLQVKTGSKMKTTPIRGNIDISGVRFKYESRNDYIFKDLNLSIREGEKVGFVGPSGCGKSTVFQLLQRFYDAESGDITIDGINIKDYDIHHLRASLGVVSQEPVLFNDTIGNNIKYNKEGLTLQQIRAAAKQSNFNPQTEKVDTVIRTDKKEMKEGSEESDNKKQKKEDGTGFDKNVGVKGSHISGGQKQRVAIARTIVREPKVLLLDEATSALDSVNEQKVQTSLDRIMEGKTSINIAHRLDTIRNSDVIMVFQKGEVVEQGSFDELLKLKGKFYRLEQGLEFI